MLSPHIHFRIICKTNRGTPVPAGRFPAGKHSLKNNVEKRGRSQYEEETTISAAGGSYAADYAAGFFFGTG